jgi:hypothetical protein
MIPPWLYVSLKALSNAKDLTLVIKWNDILDGGRRVISVAMADASTSG